ncbi:hypothetical protein COL922a_014478, partial [Colletotrichum nupharicola]
MKSLVYIKVFVYYAAVIAMTGWTVSLAGGTTSALIWNPLDFLDMLMAGERYTSGNRTACAFIALALAYSTVFSAIFENSIP